MNVDIKMVNVAPTAKNKPKYEDPVYIISNPQILILEFKFIYFLKFKN